jgi:hypothetical protein
LSIAINWVSSYIEASLTLLVVAVVGGGGGGGVAIFSKIDLPIDKIGQQKNVDASNLDQHFD